MMISGLVYLFVKPVYSVPYIAISILLLITFNHQKGKNSNTKATKSPTVACPQF
ncbi:TPA: hypothetical protein ACHVGM_000536 [Streptococcus suis]|uniref:hypothetical protein n=1 Tax=Streptococcus suis TaxID=1307 RepID=UPI0013799E74|nr:hypothetical protein [Streptococcus suis]